jgi:DNA-binding transcriptional LysR family regulator
MKAPSIQLLESLIAVYEHSSLALAAKNLNLTAPALSMQLKRLEEMFELPLFEFQGKRKILTPYGLAIYLESKKVIQDFQRSLETIDRKFLSSEKQVLRVSGRRELITMAQKKLNFKGTISFSQMSSEQSLQALAQKKIDIAITRFRPDSAEFVAKEFISSCPRLMVHEKWIKKDRSNKITEDQNFLLKTPVIIFGNSANELEEWQIGWLEKLGIKVAQLNIKFICEDWLTILQMVESGEGYALIPDTIESNHKSVKHIDLPCGSVPSFTYYFLYHKNLRKFPAYKDLFDK